MLVEQNLYIALDLSDYVYLISKGIISYESTPDEFDRDEEAKAKYLGIMDK
ncbi:MAG: hypothetical protein JW882_14950 [Deltaproteobacteria bacterium]|nr:hypothetical protein [Deltaproteobacteria bacterium]